MHRCCDRMLPEEGHSISQAAFRERSSKRRHAFSTGMPKSMTRRAILVTVTTSSFADTARTSSICWSYYNGVKTLSRMPGHLAALQRILLSVDAFFKMQAKTDMIAVIVCRSRIRSRLRIQQDTPSMLCKASAFTESLVYQLLLPVNT